MLVSLMMPTRGRYDGTRKTLESLAATTVDPSQVEVLVRADDDDPGTLQALEGQWPFAIRTTIGPRGAGYADLHVMYNELALQATGQFLFLWNNDAVMLTQGWDTKLLPFNDGKLRYFYVETEEEGTGEQLTLAAPFPIVHRSYYDALGHYSKWAHNDTYVFQVLKDYFDRIFVRPGIVVKHDINAYLNAGDVTTVEGRNAWPVTRHLRKTPQHRANVEADKQKIAALLAQQ